MELFQNIAELRTHGEDTPQVDDLPKALQYYGARIGRDLGRLHELTKGKITIGYIVEMASIYENICNTDPENVPTMGPAEIFKLDVLPAMEATLEVETIGEDDGITPTKSN